MAGLLPCEFAGRQLGGVEQHDRDAARIADPPIDFDAATTGSAGYPADARNQRSHDGRE
jgi:hypothetical protein